MVEEFLKQATKARLMDEDLSKKLNQRIENLALNTFGGINRLDMFFPFDPYLLKLSDRSAFHYFLHKFFSSMTQLTCNNLNYITIYKM